MYRFGLEIRFEFHVSSFLDYIPNNMNFLGRGVNIEK